MSTDEYCYLRNGLDYNTYTDSGRMGYRKDRSDPQVWTKLDDTLSRLWRMHDYGRINKYQSDSPRKVTLEAMATAVPGMPDRPDFYGYWAHAPLLLTAARGGPVMLGAVGLDIPEVNGYWLAETYQKPLPQDATKQTTMIRLQSMANPGCYLGHLRDTTSPIPGTDVPLSAKQLALYDHPAPQSAYVDWWWYMEFAPAPASAVKGRPVSA
ncbi:MAG: hypothetical protein ABI655_11580 [Phenylobacterium sp.]